MLFFELALPGRSVGFPFGDGGRAINAGAHPDNDIVLPFRGISRFHFTLVREDGSWVLRDLESRNGTRVNGERIRERALVLGDRIAVGVVELVVQEAPQWREDYVPVRRPSLKAVTPADTEEVGVLPIGGREEFFFFPNLTFPEGMVLGCSARILEVYQQMNAVARSSAPVFLVGETGVGKEMFARTLHLSGKRSAGPFVAVNCAALPQELLESELFGIGKRVATSVDERVGKMVMAGGGTLFLDEINAFSPALQPKILRALEERSVTPVGTGTPVPTDFRLIAASSIEPETLIRTGALREDLYHRLAALEVRVPPLRERPEDLNRSSSSSWSACVSRSRRSWRGSPGGRSCISRPTAIPATSANCRISSGPWSSWPTRSRFWTSGTCRRKWSPSRCPGTPKPPWPGASRRSGTIITNSWMRSPIYWSSTFCGSPRGTSPAPPS